jgi:Integrase zinc binding domain
VYTDHLPLVGALHWVSEPKSDCHSQQLSFIAEFTSEVHHIAGASNVVADTLSRPAAVPSYADLMAGNAAPPSPSGPLAGSAITAAAVGLHLQQSGPLAEQTTGVAAAGLLHRSSSSSGVTGAATAGPPLDVADIAEMQPACPDCQRAMHVPSLKVVEMAGKKLLVDTSSGVMRLLVPAQFRRRLFDAVHNLAHLGIRATKRLISSRYLWPNLAGDVPAWCHDCQQCQRAKVTKQPAAPVQAIPVPTTRFSHVHVDIVGPLPCSSDNFSYILTAVHWSTR